MNVDIHSAVRPATFPLRIVLTGFMGSGKTTVGPLVAHRLGWRFIDINDVIEAEAGCTIANLFTRNGEPAFRDREHATIRRLASGDSLVLALGGGAFERAETRDLLLASPAPFSFISRCNWRPASPAAAELSPLARYWPTRQISPRVIGAVSPSIARPTSRFLWTI